MKKYILFTLLSMLALAMSAQTKHKVTVTTEPLGVGKVYVVPEGESEIAGNDKVVCELSEGQVFRIGVSPSSASTLDTTNGDYTVVEWKKDGVTISTEEILRNQTMGNKDVTYTVVCKYDPKTPEIPNQNYFDKATGNLAVNEARTEGIEKGCNYRDYDKVKKLIVFGKQKTDYVYLSSIMDKLPNLKYVDMSRVSGVTKFYFGNSFYGSNHPLETLIIPECVKEMTEDFGAGKLPNLKDVVCYAKTPPTFTLYTDCYNNEKAFDGCPSGMIIHVPEASVNTYAATDGWKRFQIVPLRQEPKTLTVALPDNASDGRYKDMSIEVLNTKTGVKRSLTISGRTQYIFENMMTGTPFTVVLKNKNGVPVAQMDNVMLEFDDLSVKFEGIRELCSLTAKVNAPDGTDITEKATINWADKSGKFLYRGSNMSDVAKGDVFRYSIVLPEELGSLYAAPANVAVVANQTETITVNLETLSTITVSGTVKDKNGLSVAGATLTFSQKLNGKFPKSVVVDSDINGRFSAQIYNYAGQLTVSANRYYSLAQELQMRNTDYVLGDIVLDKIEGAVVSTELNIKSSQDKMITSTDVAFSAFNVTMNAAISKLTEQNGTLLLGSGAKAGDKVRITAKSISGSFADAVADVTIAADLTATATFALAAYGSISSTFRTTYNSEVVGILYDADGVWVKTTDYADASMTMTGIADGTYTLVTMAKSPVYNKVSSLSVLDASGLTEGQSYASNRVTVKSGEVATVSVDVVPLLNVSQTSYLSSSAMFESNKTNIVAGNYIALRGKALFADAYKDGVSNVSLVVELPSSAQFVEGSVMVGNEILKSCKPSNGRIEIPVSNPSDLVRFCVIPTESGEYTPTAMAQFTYQGSERVQLIGNATYTVENLSISVPSEVARTKFRVSGAALPNSEVSVYDGETLIGQTTTNAFGSWDLMVELQNPFNLSRHAIYAVVNTADGMTMKTETASVRYDKYAIEVDYVNMTISNHVVDDMHITFDYKTGKTSRNYYDFWGNDAFTFIVNLTNNDPALVKWVNVHVYTEGGGVTVLPATYVAHQDRWVAASYFNDNKPINVGVDFEAETEKKVSTSKFADLYKDFGDTYKYYSDRMELMKKVSNGQMSLDQMFKELGEENPADAPISIIMTDEEVEKILSEHDSEQVKADSIQCMNMLKGYLEIFNPANRGEFTDDSGNIYIIRDLKDSDLKSINEEEYLIMPTEDGQKFYYYIGTEDKVAIMDLSNYMYIEYRYSYDMSAKTRAQDGKGYKIDLPFKLPPRNFDDMMTDVNMIGGWLKTFADVLDSELDKAFYWLTNNILNTNIEIEAYKNAIGSNKVKIESLTRQMNVATDPLNKAQLNNRIITLNNDIIEKNAKIELAVKGLKDLKWLHGLVDKVQKYAKALPIMNYLKMGEDAYLIWDKWHSNHEAVPRPCPADESGANKLREQAFQFGCLSLATYCTKFVLTAALDGSSVAQGVAGIPTGGVSVGTALLTFVGRCVLGIVLDVAFGEIDKYQDKEFADGMSKLKCITDDWKKRRSANAAKIGNEDVAPRGDPSGFVYEAVSSNRVEGVTASVYYKETYEDIYGDQKEKEVLWDAEKYAQENPQVTDADGMYCWMVPSGMWRVKFEKPGYETTHSEWLPVPPPQLDVNVPISQLTAPDVVQAHAYANSVEFKFDKYMIPSTLSANNVVKVTQNGSAISGTLTALNEEACYSGSDTKYASAFCFKASKALDATKPVTLTVTSSAQSYAGVKMQEDYTVNLNIEEHLTGIEAETSVNLNPGETKSIVVSVLPAATAKGKTLVVKPSTESIASVAANEYTLNANGQATVSITANSIGGTSLKFSVADYDVTARTEVNVVDKNQMVQAPKASIASGSMLPCFTPVTLTCSTPNSTILYTTDGSCPCDNGASVMTYDGNPIILTKSMTLKAMAVVKGMIESDVSEFVYSLDPTNIAVKEFEGKISPKVTNDNVNVELDNEQPTVITIYNISGQVVLRKNITHSTSVSLASQPNGIYFLSVSQGSAISVEKIIKE